MYRVVLLRHGESQWNLENRFTGWTDVDLTPRGVEEARAAGGTLRTHGFTFDRVLTSRLKRAIKTAHLVLEEMDLLWVPVESHWRLNERHYGALQGLNKAEMAARYGEEQVKVWRRSYEVPPPPLAEDDPRWEIHDRRYWDVPRNAFPRGECLKDTVARVVPYWETVVVPKILAGERLLIAAHGNSLRALVKYLDRVDDEAIVELNIPTGQPLVYELNESCEPIRHYYLADEETIRAQQEAVAAQGRATH
ncbi:MAG: 2,3-diphosphoglycerate-dependent phosphoglycerate mutase [Hydrogenophilus sp.]|nr:2,3-diphosphoglycerate-dependent phosphoglycerate mutase [Hydrogenophilus sp.]